MSKSKEIIRQNLVNDVLKAVVSSFIELVTTAVGVYCLHPQCSSANHRLASRKSPDFDTHDSWKRVWVRACWQNTRGILGRWTEMQTAIIP